MRNDKRAISSALRIARLWVARFILWIVKIARL